LARKRSGKKFQVRTLALTRQLAQKNGHNPAPDRDLLAELYPMARFSRL
tara:strand:+ start:444 stop:590 length:147 start_codon:yes stop_codon:yes gene_type:complete